MNGDADEGVDEAWATAIERWVREARDSSVRLQDGEEVHRAIRARLASKRQ